MASNIVDRLRGVKSSQAIKVPCRVATTANITLSGEQTIDGVAVVDGDRVLVINQTDASENGIWECDTGAWSRAPDWDGVGDVVTGTTVYVTAGTDNTGFWTVTTSGVITIGSTAISFVGGIGSSDALTEGVVQLLLTPAERAKLAGYLFVDGVGDGTTSDQTEVAAKVAAAYSGGYDLYWPPGTFLTTATIPNFHDVKHRGPGIVKRGSDLFYVEPRSGVTNILYVAASGGADTNDGFSSSQPFATTQAAGNRIYKYPHADATWKVQLAAGAYSETSTFSRPFPTPNRVQFLGPAVADGVQPTAVNTSPGGAGKVGLYFDRGVKAYVEDIEFIAFRDGGAVSVSGASAGITAAGADLWTRNVWADGCDIGIEAAFHSMLRVQAGILDSCALGWKAISNTSYVIGYNGTVADATGATGTAILNCTQGGLGQEGSFGHLDFCHLQGNATAMMLVAVSRCHAMGCVFNANTLAVDMNDNCVFYDNPVTTNTFTANTNKIRSLSGSRLSGVVEESDYFGPGVKNIDTAAKTTQETSAQSVFTHAFAANELGIRNSGFKLRIGGDCVGTAGTKNVTIALGASTLLNRTITSTSLEWFIEIDLYSRTAASAQILLTRVYESGVAGVINSTGTAEDLTAAKSLTVTMNVANGADVINIRLIELEITH